MPSTNYKSPVKDSSINFGSAEKKFDNIYSVALHVGNGGNNPVIYFNSSDPSQPNFRYNTGTQKWQITDDGTRYFDLNAFAVNESTGDTTFNIKSDNDSIIQINMAGVPSSPAIKYDKAMNKWYIKTSSGTWFEMPLLTNIESLQHLTHADTTDGPVPLWNGSRWPYPISTSTPETSNQDTWPASTIIEKIQNALDARISNSVSATSNNATWPASKINSMVTDLVSSTDESDTDKTFSSKEATNHFYLKNTIEHIRSDLFTIEPTETAGATTTVDVLLFEKDGSNALRTDIDNLPYPIYEEVGGVVKLDEDGNPIVTYKKDSSNNVVIGFDGKPVIAFAEDTGGVLATDSLGHYVPQYEYEADGVTVKRNADNVPIIKTTTKTVTTTTYSYFNIIAKDATKNPDFPGLRYNAQNSMWEYSNDGSTWSAMGEIYDGFNLDQYYYRKERSAGDPDSNPAEETYSSLRLLPSKVEVSPGKFEPNMVPGDGVLDERYYVKEQLLPPKVESTPGSGNFNTPDKTDGNGVLDERYYVKSVLTPDPVKVAVWERDANGDRVLVSGVPQQKVIAGEPEFEDDYDISPLDDRYFTKTELRPKYNEQTGALDSRYFTQKSFSLNRTNVGLEVLDENGDNVPYNDASGNQKTRSVLSSEGMGALDNRYFTEDELLPPETYEALREPIMVQDEDVSGAPLFDGDGNPVMVQKKDATTGKPLFNALRNADGTYQVKVIPAPQGVAPLDSRYYTKATLDEKFVEAFESKGLDGTGDTITLGKNPDANDLLIQRKADSKGSQPGIKYNATDKVWQISTDGTEWAKLMGIKDDDPDSLKVTDLYDVKDNVNSTDLAAPTNYGKALIVKDISGMPAGTRGMFELSAEPIVRKFNELLDAPAQAQFRNKAYVNRPLLISVTEYEAQPGLYDTTYALNWDTQKIVHNIYDLADVDILDTAMADTANAGKTIVLDPTTRKFVLSDTDFVTKLSSLTDVKISSDTYYSDPNNQGKSLVVKSDGMYLEKIKLADLAEVTLNSSDVASANNGKALIVSGSKFSLTNAPVVQAEGDVTDATNDKKVLTVDATNGKYVLSKVSLADLKEADATLVTDISNITDNNHVVTLTSAGKLSTKQLSLADLAEGNTDLATAISGISSNDYYLAFDTSGKLVVKKNTTSITNFSQLEDVDILDTEINNASNQGKMLVLGTDRTDSSKVKFKLSTLSKLPEYVSDLLDASSTFKTDLAAASQNGKYVLGVVDNEIAIVDRSTLEHSLLDLKEADNTLATDLAAISDNDHYLAFNSSGNLVIKKNTTSITNLSQLEDVDIQDTEISDPDNQGKMLILGTDRTDGTTVKFKLSAVSKIPEHVGDLLGVSKTIKTDLLGAENGKYLLGVVDNKIAVINKGDSVGVSNFFDLKDVAVSEESIKFGILNNTENHAVIVRDGFLNLSDNILPTVTSDLLDVAYSPTDVSEANDDTYLLGVDNGKISLIDKQSILKSTHLRDVGYTDDDLVDNSGATTVIPNEGHPFVVGDDGKIVISTKAQVKNYLDLDDVSVPIGFDITSPANEGKFFVIKNGQFELSDTANNKIIDNTDVDVTYADYVNNDNLGKALVVSIDSGTPSFKLSDYALKENISELNDVNIPDLVDRNGTNARGKVLGVYKNKIPNPAYGTVAGVPEEIYDDRVTMVDAVLLEDAVPEGLLNPSTNEYDDASLADDVASKNPVFKKLKDVWLLRSDLYREDTTEPIGLDVRYYTRDEIDEMFSMTDGFEVTDSSTILLGPGDGSQNIIAFSANIDATKKPATIRYEGTKNKWQISNDGNNFVDLQVIDDSVDYSSINTSATTGTVQNTWSLRKFKVDGWQFAIDDGSNSSNDKKTWSTKKLSTDVWNFVISDTSANAGSSQKTWSGSKLTTEFAKYALLSSTTGSRKTSTTANEKYAYSVNDINTFLDTKLNLDDSLDITSQQNQAKNSGYSIYRLHQELIKYPFLESAAIAAGKGSNKDLYTWTADKLETKFDSIISDASDTSATSTWSIDKLNNTFLNKNGDLTTEIGHQKFLLGTPDSSNYWELVANVSSTTTNPVIRFNGDPGSGKWEYSADGTNFFEIGDVDPSKHNHDTIYYRKSELIDEAAPLDTTGTYVLDARYPTKTDLIDASAANKADVSANKLLDDRYFVKDALVDPTDPTANPGSMPLDARYYSQLDLLPGGEAEPLKKDVSENIIPAKLDGRYYNKEEAKEVFIRTSAPDKDAEGNYIPQQIEGSLQVSGDIIGTFSVTNALTLQHLKPAAIKTSSSVVVTDSTGMIDASFIPNFKNITITAVNSDNSEVIHSDDITIKAGNNVRIDTDADSIVISSHVEPWKPDTVYKEGQLVTQGNRVYQCTSDHTSNSTRWSADLEAGSERWKVIGIYNAIPNNQVESNTVNAFFVTASSSNPKVITAELENPADYKKTDVEIYKFVHDTQGYNWSHEFTPSKFTEANLSELTVNKFVTVTHNKEITLSTTMDVNMDEYATNAIDGKTYKASFSMDDFKQFEGLKMLIDE